MSQHQSDALLNKWTKVLDNENFSPIKENYKRSVTAVLLENTVLENRKYQSLISEADSNSSDVTNVSGGVDKWDPVLVSLVRRAAPNLIAFDIAGVQPMTGPTGLLFALRSRYTSQAGSEALFNEADTDFSGTGTHAGASDGFAADQWGSGDPATGTSAGTGQDTATGEALGTVGGSDFPQMAFTIEKTTVSAKTRALKAEYSTELSQDLKAIHGLDAETELANILSNEVLAEINRELIRTINISAELGASATTTAGIFDLSTDSDGRWSKERWYGLYYQIEKEANQIAKNTRRGKGNFIITSSDVASALALSGVLEYSPEFATNLTVDDTGNTFAGILNNRYRVYVDPYSTTDYVTVGYKGTSPFDAGVFYAPYVPLQMVKAVGEDSFQPKIGFKTRYGLVANPFVETDSGSTGLGQGENYYYRKFRVDNILALNP